MINKIDGYLEKIVMSALNTPKFHLRGLCRQFVVRQADRSYLFRALLCASEHENLLVLFTLDAGMRISH